MITTPNVSGKPGQAPLAVCTGLKVREGFSGETSYDVR